ncbi:hypothetical protein SAMN04515668_0477 [Hymenobacter arizonensis]|uniref:SpoIIAA-like n=2 Tax=Hymenobacter arizonensis TaxID=1227077 RepID=A0A1I5TH97_HYMAR|nr:hypothetical protein SAMN04515668_0477 [Hymenobacter arizonensis]
MKPVWSTLADPAARLYLTRMLPLAPEGIYFENAAGRLVEHPNGYALVRYYPGPRKFSDFQALLTHLSSLLARRRWNRLLSDQRQMSPHTAQETAWLRDVWLGATSRRPGPRYGAVLRALDVFARLSMNQVLHEARGTGLVYREFDREEEAAQWLRQVR